MSVQKNTDVSKVVFHPLFSLSVCLSCRIFEHFVILPDLVIELIKLRSALHKQGTISAPKQADPLSLLNKQIHPFHLDRVSSQTWIQ
jgi:hypothetical protein